ncbi:MAG: hypothetical protein ACTHQM_24280 [Thermoanaerobaculia bacterium]
MNPPIKHHQITPVLFYSRRASTDTIQWMASLIATALFRDGLERYDVFFDAFVRSGMSAGSHDQCGDTHREMFIEAVNAMGDAFFMRLFKDRNMHNVILSALYEVVSCHSRPSPSEHLTIGELETPRSSVSTADPFSTYEQCAQAHAHLNDCETCAQKPI